MGKFRFRVKLQGLEVEIDGDREDLPVLTAAVEKQFGGLMLPVEVVSDNHRQLTDGSGGNDSGTSQEEGGKRKRTPRRERRAATGDGAPAVPVEFRHDPAKYGNPVQGWGVAEKCIWLLYVIKGITATKEVSGPALAATFNQYFKPAGKIHPPHVTRDLAKVKVQNPAPIGEDKGNYYLTDEGDKQAQQLIQNALNPAK
jgi:hypothetical protein